MQRGVLGPQLLAAGWQADTPVLVVSRAGWPDQRVSEHTVQRLAAASPVHESRPTIVTVGAGARPISADPMPHATAAQALQSPETT